MAGLIEKDLRILLKRKKILAVFVVFAAVYGFILDGGFIVSYLPFLSMIIAISTVAYDEAENGLMYLMTLPISRKDYVKEKYGFVCGITLLTWFIAFIGLIATDLLKGMDIVFMEELIGALIILPMVFIMAFVMIPVDIKYGAELSRMVLGILACGIALLFVLFTKILPASLTGSLVENLSDISDVMVLVSLWVVTIVAGAVSYLLSVRWLDQKTF